MSHDPGADEHAEHLAPLDAILLGAESGAKLAIVGIINAAIDPYKSLVDELHRENAELTTRIEELTAEADLLRNQNQALQLQILECGWCGHGRAASADAAEL